MSDTRTMTGTPSRPVEAEIAAIQAEIKRLWADVMSADDGRYWSELMAAQDRLAALLACPDGTAVGVEGE